MAQSACGAIIRSSQQQASKSGWRDIVAGSTPPRYDTLLACRKRGATQTRPVRRRDQTKKDCSSNRLSAIANAELGDDVSKVEFHRVSRQVQLGRNLLCAQTLRSQFEKFEFAGAQAGLGLQQPHRFNESFVETRIYDYQILFVRKIHRPNDSVIRAR